MGQPILNGVVELLAAAVGAAHADEPVAGHLGEAVHVGVLQEFVDYAGVLVGGFKGF